METLFLISITVAAVLYVMSDTSAPEEYYKLYLKAFKKESKITNLPSGHLYEDFDFWDRAQLECGGFWVKLLACPFCSGVWVAVFLNLITINFNIFHWGTTTFLGWVFYLLLKMLVKCNNKLYE